MGSFKVYLASPFFNEEERAVKQKIKKHIINILGWDVLDPQPIGGCDKTGWEISNDDWGRNTFKNDIALIDSADLIVAIDWGMYSDTGTSWEVGYGFGHGKRIVVVIPDKTTNEIHSLMVAHGSETFITESRFLSENSLGNLLGDKVRARGVRQG